MPSNGWTDLEVAALVAIRRGVPEHAGLDPWGSSWPSDSRDFIGGQSLALVLHKWLMVQELPGVPGGKE